MSGVVADLYANFYANTGPLKTGLEGAKSMIQNFTSKLGGVAGAGIAIGAVTAGMAMLSKGIKESISYTQTYGNNVKNLSLLLSQSSASTSMLMEMTDDLGISYEGLSTSMKFAMRNGINPTVEGLAQLSDKYLALQDPVKRTQLLLNSFGRSGEQMARMMVLGSDGIIALAQSTVGSGKIINGMQLQIIENYRKTTDAINDVGEAGKLSIGTKLMPVMDKWRQAWVDTWQPLNKMRDEASLVIDKNYQLTDSYEEWLTKTAQEIPQYRELAKLHGANALGISKNILVADGYTKSLFEQSKASKSLIQLTEEERYELQNSAEKMLLKHSIVQDGTSYLDEYSNSLSELAGREKELQSILKAGGLKKKDRAELQSELEGIQGKRTGAGKTAEFKTGTSIFDTITSGFKFENWAAIELARTLGILNNEQYAVEMGAQMAGRAIDKNADGMISLSEMTSEAGGKVAGLSGHIAGLKSKGIAITVDIIYRYFNGGGGGTGSGAVTIGQAREAGFTNTKDLKVERGGNAKGANFIVPPGYPNDSYNMLVESGEKVIVIPRNKVNQIPKMRYGTGETPGSGRRDIGGGLGVSPSVTGSVQELFGSMTGTEYGAVQELFGSMGGGSGAGKLSTSANMEKAIGKSITPIMAGIVTSQTAKTTQQIATISSRQAETAQKNSMISSDMLAELIAIRKYMQSLPIEIRDAVMLVSG